MFQTLLAASGIPSPTSFRREGPRAHAWRIVGQAGPRCQGRKRPCRTRWSTPTPRADDSDSVRLVALCWKRDSELGLARVRSTRDCVSRGRSFSAFAAIGYQW